MKKIKLFACLFVAAIAASCSSDSNSNTTPVNTNEYFTYNDAGADVTITHWTAIRSEDTFEVLGETADGSSMYLNFNSAGVLVRAASTSPSGSSIPWRNSAYDFSSDSFNFHLMSVDPINKMVTLTYGGKLYEDDNDQTSPFAMATGTASVHYTEVAPQIAGLGFSAKIAGNTWHGVKSYTTNNGPIENVVLSFNSDDKNQISLYFNHYNTDAGTYSFNAASLNNKVVLSVYNPTTRLYTDYNCAGTFKIDEKTTSFNTTLIRGSFSLTATNPTNGSVIQITDGAFKEVYTY